MLPIINKRELRENTTCFLAPEQDGDGKWKVKATRNNVCIKMTYTLSEEDAKIIRGSWINRFHGYTLN